jgi:hypothetical protein
VPGNMLRMIEEAANDDPVEMQNGFTAYDGCSGKSKLNRSHRAVRYSLHVLL